MTTDILISKEKRLNISVNDLLSKSFESVDAGSFYCEIFGDYAQKSKEESHNKKGNIVITDYNSENPNFGSKSFTLDPEAIKTEVEGKKCKLIRPCLFFGKSANRDSLASVHALVVDIDGMNQFEHYVNILDCIKYNKILRPTYIVASGHGLHLFYSFKTPVFLNYQNKRVLYEALTEISNSLTKAAYTLKTSSRTIYNSFKKTLEVHPDYHSIMQGYRAVGSLSKFGTITKAYRVGKQFKDASEIVSKMMDTIYFNTHRCYSTNFYNSASALKIYYENQKVIFKNADFSRSIYTLKNDRQRFRLENYIKTLKRDVVPGFRYKSLFYAVILYMKNGYSDCDIRDQITHLCDYLNQKAKLIGAPLLSKDDKIALLDLLKEREKYVSLCIKNEYLENSTGLHFEKRKKNGLTRKEHVKYLKDNNLITGRKKTTVYSSKIGASLLKETIHFKGFNFPNKELLAKRLKCSVSSIYGWKKRILEAYSDLKALSVKTGTSINTIFESKLEINLSEKKSEKADSFSDCSNSLYKDYSFKSFSRLVKQPSTQVLSLRRNRQGLKSFVVLKERLVVTFDNDGKKSFSQLDKKDVSRVVFLLKKQKERIISLNKKWSKKDGQDERFYFNFSFTKKHCTIYKGGLNIEGNGVNPPSIPYYSYSNS